MSFFSFKKINLFRNNSSVISPGTSGSDSKGKKEKPIFWKKLINHPALFLFVFVVSMAYLISYLPSKSLPDLEEGEIASVDIVAPENLTIIDEETTKKREKASIEAVLPVYNFDPNVFLNLQEKTREFFNSGRQFIKTPLSALTLEEFIKATNEKYGFSIPAETLRGLVKLRFASALEDNLINLTGKVLDQGIILTKNLFIHGEQEKGLTLVYSPGNEKIVSISEFLDMKESKQILSQEIIELELPQNEKKLLTELSHAIISDNITFNSIETTARQEKAREEVEAVYYTIKKGKVIIRKGDEVSKDTIKQIAIINQNLSEKPTWLTNFAGTFLLLGLIFIALFSFLEPRQAKPAPLKKFLMTGITLLLSLVVYKVCLGLAPIFSQNANLSFLKYTENYRYAFPFQLGTLLFSYLSGIYIALIYNMVNSILVGYLFNSSFEFMIFSLIGGFAAILSINKYFRTKLRTTILRASLLIVAPVNIVIILIFHLIRQRIGPFDFLISELFMGFLGGLLGGALAFLFLPVFENLFGICTQNKLLELASSDLPIFRKMAIEAPGSYHHSLLVASLGEAAAEELGLDALLVKVGALYHDIGKIKRPEYFVENRTRRSDLHKSLKPSMSKLVIVNHVKEGLEKAQKLRLPKKIKDIVAQHHGTSLVRYFFEKAKEEYDPEMQTIGEESYRYTGPTPKTKEGAIVMLADSVEAASRSIKSPSEANLKRAISDIVDNYVKDSQLDDCKLSIKDLKIIASSFLSSLTMIYLPRPEYPGFDFERKKADSKESKNENDRNNKPAKKIQNKHKDI